MLLVSVQKILFSVDYTSLLDVKVKIDANIIHHSISSGPDI